VRRRRLIAQAPMRAFVTSRCWNLAWATEVSWDPDAKPSFLIQPLNVRETGRAPVDHRAQLRRAGELTTGTTSIRVRLGEAEVVVGVELRRFPNGGYWWLLVCPCCRRSVKVLRLFESRIACWRCVGLRHGSECLRPVRRAQRRIELLRARLDAGPARLRPGRTVERRTQLMASLRRSEAVVRRHRAGRILVALKAEMG
jgi:hypothetical protein